MCMQQVACNLCGAKNENLLFDAYDVDYQMTEKQFRLVRCLDCGLVYINPRPEENEMQMYYPDTYRPYKRRTGVSVFRYTEPINPTKRVLDVGCGNGELLEVIAEQDKDVALCGIDTDERAVAVSRASGFPVIHGTLFDACYPDSYFDEIYIMHVLEHVQDPYALLKEIFRVLKPAGRVKIEMPNFRSVSRMIFGRNWKRLDAPRHLYHFTPATLHMMLHKAGFSKSVITGIASPKYFLQSFAFWRQGKKRSYPRFVWYVFMPPARIVAWAGFSSTMRAVVEK